MKIQSQSCAQNLCAQAVPLLASTMLLAACSGDGSDGNESSDGTGGASVEGQSTGGAGTGGDMMTSTGGNDSSSGGSVGTGGDGMGTGGGTGEPTEKAYFVYLGSGSWDEEAGAVTVLGLDRETATLTPVSSHPAGGFASFLYIDEQRGVLHAVDEKDGGVISFLVNGATGELSDPRAVPESTHPVYLTVDETGQYLLAANYVEGSASVYPLDAMGRAQAQTQELATGGWAHSITVDAQGNGYVANVQSETISQVALSGGALSLRDPASVSQPGGPRHFALSLDGTKAYANGEAGDSIAYYDVDASGFLSPDGTIPRLPPADSGDPVSNSGADLQVSPSGKFLYSTNRGSSNTIAVYSLDGSGVPTLVEHEPSGGASPRNLAIAPDEDILIVGNHGDKTLGIFRIESDGSLTHQETKSVEVSPYFVGIAAFPVQ